MNETYPKIAPSERELPAMNLANTKVLVSILFGVFRLIFGLLPLKLCRFLKLRIDSEESKARKQKLTCGLGLFQAFGGGVIFATCFLHMMPEVYESTIQLKKFGLIEAHYPFSQLIVSIGFFLVYFIEEIAHYFVSRVPSESKAEKPKTPKNRVEPSKPKEVDVISVNEDEGVEIRTPNTPDREASQRQEEIEEEVADLKETIEKSDAVSTDELANVAELDEIIQTGTLTQQQIIRGILIVLALSLHGFFEGLAIGLQTSVANIWYLFIAVSIHSAAILFVVSLELVLANAKVKIIVIHVLILSIVCPLGVLLGLLITLNTEESKAETVAVVFLEGLSAGTITYITFFEVLSREKRRRIYRLRRAVFIILGFCLMAVLECFEM